MSHRLQLIFCLFFLTLIALVAWSNLFAADTTAVIDSVKEATERKFRLTLSSVAFKHFSTIPSEYTCDGVGISPPLSWNTLPDTVKSFALVCDDPDAPTGVWTHWVIYNIPARVHDLKANLPRDSLFADGTRNALNSWGKIGYGGPCPPEGTHRYFFKLYALDALLSLKGKVREKELMAAMNGHVVSRTELMGRYEKR